MNLYNKAYKKNEEVANAFVSPQDAMTKSFESAARMMEKLAKACEENNYEERAAWSEKILLMMDYIQGSLDRETPAQKQAARKFEDFVTTFSGVISGINITNNPELARKMVTNLQSMAQMWRG